jgi:D-proline reductase (dithiol) PrdB
MEHYSLDIRQTKDKLIARVLTRYPSLFNRWAKGADIIQFKHLPWTKLSKGISQSRLALITTGGVHLSSHPPFNMKDSSGDPSFREIPADIPVHDLTITHNYYDHSDADKDVNIVFPIERIKDLERAGDIGRTNHRHFSFMGHIMGHHKETLINETAPRVATELKKDGVDIVLLTPA